MATTYKDYYIYYNGTLISSNENTGLTAVNIYYNGTYIGEGAHTLNCAGQYMNGNIVIGGKTLNCSGQYMNGNVQVTTQNRYKWNKYNANPRYYTVYGSMSGSTSYQGIASSASTGSYLAYKAGGVPSVNTSNGQYTFSNTFSDDGSSVPRIQGSTSYSAANACGTLTTTGYYYAVNDETSGEYVDNLTLRLMTSKKDFVFQSYYTSRNKTFKWRYDYSALTHDRGTLIGTVDSTNASAHTNGYNSDGYWYEAI